MSESTVPDRLYHRNLYRFGDPEPSYWEATQGDTKLAAKPLIGNEQRGLQRACTV